MVLEGYKPENVLYYFEEISKIPHGSYNTKAISDYVVSVCKDAGLEYYQDEVNNVIAYKKAYKGFEDVPPVMLQGHLDMVCEKNFETDARFDFTKDSLKLAVMDDYVYAKGTTLGGDDGIGVAYMLALLTDESVVAPALECVFTVDEEVGMDGAHALDVSKLKSKRLINLDHEDEGIILTSCAGGKSAVLTCGVRRVERIGIKYVITICGLKGGHSGTEINKYRGNANLIMGRLLHNLSKSVYFDLLSIDGGLQDNAIPRECMAEVLVNEKDTDEFEAAVYAFEAVMKNEFRSVEEDMMIYCENVDRETAKVLTPKTRERIIFLLMTLPDGVGKMSADTDNLVQTSSNVGIVHLNKDNFVVNMSIRSSVTSEKQALSDKIQYLVETIGGTFKEEGDYPAWEYVEDSPLRETCIKCFQEQYGCNPRIEGIHAGLETGLFYEKIKGLDIVVIGPQVEDIHTPKERMNLPSVERVYNYLLAILKELTK